MPAVPVRPILSALAVAIAAAACSTSTSTESNDVVAEPSVVQVETSLAVETTSDEPSTTVVYAPSAGAGPTDSVGSPRAEDVPPCEPESEPDTPTTPGPTVALEEVGRFAGGTVYAAEYPVPDDRGDPWSQWGQGIVLPDGRFISGVGDHRGQNGRSWFYEYDPVERTLTQTTEVSAALGHERGDWGYGKLHAPMVLDRCDRVLTSTYWGSRRGIEFGGSYTGDHLIRYDPATRSVTSLGVPVPRHGLPSLALSPDRSTVFLEAVEPDSSPDTGAFVVVDADDGTVELVEQYPQHRMFRDVLVTPDGDALVASGNGLIGLSATGESLEERGVFGGESVLRSVSDPSETGDIAISTRKPDEMWLREPSGEMRSLGPNEEYVASVALTLDGSTIYYVPGAHGDGVELGTPLVALDTATGKRNDIIRLNDLIEPALGTRVGGSYNVVFDDESGRLFIGLNGGDPNDDETFGSVVLAVVEFDHVDG